MLFVYVETNMIEEAVSYLLDVVHVKLSTRYFGTESQGSPQTFVAQESLKSKAKEKKVFSLQFSLA